MPRALRVRRWGRVAASAASAAVPALGTIAMSVGVGLATAIVLAAAERPGVLSGPARRGFPGWMVGPLAHRLPSLPDDPLAMQGDVLRALIVLGAAWLVATVCASRVPAPVVWSAVIAAQVVLLLGPPLSLTDLFNYLHYGRMAALYHSNPYVVPPLSVPADAAYRYSNWHHLPSPYGPLFTLGTEALVALPLAAAYWVWKGIVLATSLGLLALVAWMAPRFGRSPRTAVALVGLNPLVLVYGIGGAHNEPLVLLAAAAAVALAVRGGDEGTSAWWDAGAGACALLAAGLKPSAAVLAPVVVVACRRRGAAAVGAAVTAAALGAVTLLAYGAHLPAASIQDRLVTPWSLPNVLAALAGQGGLTASDRTLAHAALALAVLGACVAVARRRALLPGAAGFVMLAAALTLGWTMPWYVWWVLPFAALARTRALAVACVALSLWLGLGAIPQNGSVLHSVGYFPTRTAVGRANHLYMEHYLK
jgi:alpha-1,6-mannosyltransferase